MATKSELCDEIEVLVKEAIEKSYNDSTKLSLMDEGVTVDEYGTKVFTLSGGLNGKGQWNEYLQTLAIFTVELIDKLRNVYGEGADVWLINLKNDCADDIFYPVFGVKVGEEFDETELQEATEINVNPMRPEDYAKQFIKNPGEAGDFMKHAEYRAEWYDLDFKTWKPGKSLLDEIYQDTLDRVEAHGPLLTQEQWLKKYRKKVDHSKFDPYMHKNLGTVTGTDGQEYGYENDWNEEWPFYQKYVREMRKFDDILKS